MDQLVDVARSLLDSPWLFVVVLGLTFLDCFLPAVPSDEAIISVAALAVASDREAVLLGLFAVAAVGALAGDSAGYGIGRRIPRERLARFPRLGRAVAAADRQLERRGARVVVTARFVPVVRIGVNVVAGGAMPLRTWLPAAVVACTLWAGFTVVVGSVAGFGLGDRPLLAMVVGMAIGIGVGVLVDRVLARRGRPTTPVAA